MSIEEKVGQMLHVASLFNNKNWPSKEMQKVIQEFKPGAVRIYGRTVSPYFRAEYINQLQKWAEESGHGIPLMIGSDCEYGPADMLTHMFNTYPFLMGRTASNSVEHAEDISAAIAREVKAMGLNMLHQPTVDVNTNPTNPVIGVRSAGDQTDTVVKYSKALLRGLQKEKVISIAKHFPGHGDTALDSHYNLPSVEYGKDKLEEIHLKPFREIINAGVDGIMSAHVIIKCLDDKYPGTLSKKIMTNLLREKEKFDGFIVTDGMTMKAIAENFGPAESAVMAVEAGADMVLASGDFKFQQRTREGLIYAVHQGRISENRINNSVKRLLKVKKKYNLLNRRKVDPLEAQAETEKNYTFSRESYEKTFTLVGNDDLLPVSGEDKTILFTGVKEVNNFLPYLNKDFKGNILSYQAKDADNNNDWNPSHKDIEMSLKTSALADTAVIFTFTYNKFPKGQKELVEKLSQKLPVIVVSLGLPYEYSSLTNKITYIATYMQNRNGNPKPLSKAGAEALVRVLIGRVLPQGELPVTL